MDARDLDVTNPFPTGSGEHDAYLRAYNLALAHSYNTAPALSARVLGFMLQELPWDVARSTVAREVNSCISDQKLVDLGQFYISHFFRSCEEIKQSGSR
jgi:hypothetical protein